MTPEQLGRGHGIMRPGVLGHVAGLAAWSLLLAATFLAGMTGAAAATPVGTWLTNTAVVEFNQPVTTVPGAPVRTTVYSNAADTQVAAPPADSTGPVIGTAQFTPVPVRNNGATVRLAISVVDTQTRVDSVMVHLAPVGLADSSLLRDDGLGADTLAGDGIWNILFAVDTNIPAETYSLLVQARDSAGNWSRRRSSLAVQDHSPSMATIISLGVRRAIRVSGNAVSLFVGRSAVFSKVLFQYRSEAGGAWANCAVADWSDPNPDTFGPQWGILWDMTALPEDTYLVRATGWNAAGESDASPAALLVVKDDRDSWLNEYNDTGSQVRVRRHLFGTDIQDTTIMNGGTSFTMPTTAMDSPAIWIRMTEYRTGGTEAPPPTSGSGLLVPGSGAFRRYVREDGASAFADWVTLTLPYPEGDLGVPEDRLDVYRYDTVFKTWVKEPGAVLDKTQRTLTVRVRHFTDFAVLGQVLAQGLGGAAIFPNPWKPGDGNATTGVEYVPGVANTGITFEQLPPSSVVSIYTALGEMVIERTVDATGTWQWDVRNGRGAPVASGVYVYRITSPTGERRAGKLVIIR